MLQQISSASSVPFGPPAYSFGIPKSDLAPTATGFRFPDTASVASSAGPFGIPRNPIEPGFDAPPKEDPIPVINSGNNFSTTPSLFASGPSPQRTSLFHDPYFSPQSRTRQILCELYPNAGVQIAEEDVKKLADAGYYAKFLLEHPDRVTLERINLPAPLVDYLVNTPTIKSLQESVESLRSTIVDMKENLPKLLMEVATQSQHQSHLSNQRFC